MRMSAPPVMRRGFRDWGAEMALNCSKIWRASSLNGLSADGSSVLAKVYGVYSPCWGQYDGEDANGVLGPFLEYGYSESHSLP